MTATRPLRADAQRNRQRVLDVAQEVFAAEGLAVPIDEIARRAGLGVGTLYRHFPTKEALFEAIVVGRMEGLVERARAGAESCDPGAAFFAFVALFVAEGAVKKDFVAALASQGVDLARVGALKVKLGRAVSVLIERAQDVGAVRADVGATDVMTLLMGVMGAADHRGAAPAERKRLLQVVVDGLRERTGRGAKLRPSPKRRSVAAR